MNALRLRGVALVAIVLLSSTELSPRSCALAAPAGVVAYVPQKPSRGLGAVLDWGLAKIERASAWKSRAIELAQLRLVSPVGAPSIGPSSRTSSPPSSQSATTSFRSFIEAPRR